MSGDTRRDDGGPAFPHPPVLNGETGPDSYWSQHPAPGMSLRDYFAGQALDHAAYRAALLENGELDTEAVATFAYAIADAMLEARKR